MSVIDRLRRLTGEKKPAKKESKRENTLSELRQRVDAIMSRRPEPKLRYSRESSFNSCFLEEVVQGEEIENERGKFFIAHARFHESSYHGCRCIKELSTLDMKTAALLANNTDIKKYNVTDGLFLDTETTGLSGGTGTIAFLIGLGWFEGDHFITQQLFARDFTEEGAVLSYLMELAKGKAFLVTFNGKSFDINLLAARFTMNRLRDPLSDLPHFDLLHPSRRLLGHRLENTRLSTLEEKILGFYRKGDVPGSEIPQLYFDWLRKRNGHLMKHIFEHNRFDVVSMATLSVHLTDMLNPDYRTKNGEYSDLLAAARLLHDRDHVPNAQNILESILKCCDCVHTSLEARKMLSLSYKRHDRWEEAIKLWEEIISHDPFNFFATEELAKWHEHKVRNYERAIELVNYVLSNNRKLAGSEKEFLVYRLNRLRKKL